MRRKDGLPQNRPRRYPYGVTFNRIRQKFVVKFKRAKRNIHIGYFANLDDATTAADQWLRS